MEKEEREGEGRKAEGVLNPYIYRTVLWKIKAKLK